eukprot:gene11638-biopygen8122
MSSIYERVGVMGGKAQSTPCCTERAVWRTVCWCRVPCCAVWCRAAPRGAVWRRAAPCGAVCHAGDALWCRVALYSVVCIVCFAPEQGTPKLSGQQPAGTVERRRKVIPLWRHVVPCAV